MFEHVSQPIEVAASSTGYDFRNPLTKDTFVAISIPEGSGTSTPNLESEIEAALDQLVTRFGYSMSRLLEMNIVEEDPEMATYLSNLFFNLQGQPA